MKRPLLALISLLCASLAYTPAEATPALPSGEGECVVRTRSAITIYTRPSSSAEPFAEVSSGFVQPMKARTPDGWLGFDPGIPQAANLGPFRLRWVWHADGELSGNCAGLPVMWAPTDDYCYNMPMDAVLVHSLPNASSRVVTTLQQGEFAAVMGITESGWAEVDLELGNTELMGTGWVDAQTLNLNGSACTQLPRLSP